MSVSYCAHNHSASSLVSSLETMPISLRNLLNFGHIAQAPGYQHPHGPLTLRKVTNFRNMTLRSIGDKRLKNGPVVCTDPLTGTQSRSGLPWPDRMRAEVKVIGAVESS
jgi:hypothetical protein